MPSVSIAGVFSKPRSQAAADLAPQLIAWLKAHGVTARLDENTAAYEGSCEGRGRDEIGAEAQLLIVLGGDGTLLSAARAVAGRDTPIFAVNLGGLGFLTSIKTGELYPQLERALRGELKTDRRRMLLTELWRAGKLIASYQGLNDTVLSKAEIARMIDLGVFVDDGFLGVYKADGLIISTPTGSTAYSLSAGGPILFPSVAALSITPICPHMLTNRPVIVPDESVIQITVQGTDRATYLTIDGQVGELLKEDDRVLCRRSDNSISLIRPPELRFFDVLREKLSWGGR
jgi:NAD+ kinase